MDVSRNRIANRRLPIDRKELVAVRLSHLNPDDAHEVGVTCYSYDNVGDTSFSRLNGLERCRDDSCWRDTDLTIICYGGVVGLIAHGNDLELIILSCGTTLGVIVCLTQVSRQKRVLGRFAPKLEEARVVTDCVSKEAFGEWG